MTRLVVTADAEAEADINDILDYLHKEAEARIATSYGRKLAAIIERLV
jgi:plasmid stabilization system protein ParE